jgi:hypothetical protein
MMQSETPSLVDELLSRRRHYLRHCRECASAGPPPLGETDYVLAWYFLQRLRIATVHVDDADLARLFPGSAPAPNMSPARVAVRDDNASPSFSAGTAFDSLYFLNAARKPSAAWLAGAAGEGSLVCCYGIRGFMDGSFGETLRALAAGREDAVLVPLWSIAPPLWRAAAMLIAWGTRRALLDEVVRQLSDTFCGDDLDTLRLAEENLALRSDHGALDEMKSLVGRLEVQVASLRRTALAQEETIAELERSGGPNQPQANQDGRLHSARK